MHLSLAPRHSDALISGGSPSEVRAFIVICSRLILSPFSLELPWFGEAPGYYNTSVAGATQAYPVMAQYPGGVYPQAQPGQAIVVQPGINGQMPTITQVPFASAA